MPRSPVRIAAVLALTAAAGLTGATSSLAAADTTCPTPPARFNLKSVKTADLSCAKAIKIAKAYDGTDPKGYNCSEKRLNADDDKRVICRVEGDGASRAIFVRTYPPCPSGGCRGAGLPPLI